MESSKTASCSVYTELDNHRSRGKDWWVECSHFALSVLLVCSLSFTVFQVLIVSSAFDHCFYFSYFQLYFPLCLQQEIVEEEYCSWLLLSNFSYGPFGCITKTLLLNIQRIVVWHFRACSNSHPNERELHDVTSCLTLLWKKWEVNKWI